MVNKEYHSSNIKPNITDYHFLRDISLLNSNVSKKNWYSLTKNK